MLSSIRSFFFRKPQQKWLVTCLQCPGALFTIDVKQFLPHQPQRFWKFLHPSVTQVQKGPGLRGIPFGSGWKFDHISQTSKYLKWPIIHPDTTWNRGAHVFFQKQYGALMHFLLSPGASPEAERKLDESMHLGWLVGSTEVMDVIKGGDV